MYVHGGPEVGHRAYGYSEQNGSWTRTDQSVTSATRGDGGIYSSIDDLAKWDAALYDDRLLSDASRQLAFSPHVKVTGEPYEAELRLRLAHHRRHAVAFRRKHRLPQRDRALAEAASHRDPAQQPQRSRAVPHRAGDRAAVSSRRSMNMPIRTSTEHASFRVDAIAPGCCCCLLACCSPPARTRRRAIRWRPGCLRPTTTSRRPVLIVVHFTNQHSVQESLRHLAHAQQRRPGQRALSDRQRRPHLPAGVRRRGAPGMPAPGAGARSPTSTPPRSASSWTTTAHSPFAQPQIDSLLRLLDRPHHAPAHSAHADHRPCRISPRAQGRSGPAVSVAATGRCRLRAWPRGALVDPPAGFDPWMALA